MKAVTPDGRSVELGFPPLGFRTADPDHYRFTPDGKALVILRGQYRQESFWRFDFDTRQFNR